MRKQATTSLSRLSCQPARSLGSKNHLAFFKESRYSHVPDPDLENDRTANGKSRSRSLTLLRAGVTQPCLNKGILGSVYTFVINGECSDQEGVSEPTSTLKDALLSCATIAVKRRYISLYNEYSSGSRDPQTGMSTAVQTLSDPVFWEAEDAEWRSTVEDIARLVLSESHVSSRDSGQPNFGVQPLSTEGNHVRVGTDSQRKTWDDVRQKLTVDISSAEEEEYQRCRA